MAINELSRVTGPSAVVAAVGLAVDALSGLNCPTARFEIPEGYAVGCIGQAAIGGRKVVHFMIA